MDKLVDFLKTVSQKMELSFHEAHHTYVFCVHVCMLCICTFTAIIRIAFINL